MGRRPVRLIWLVASAAMACGGAVPDAGLRLDFDTTAFMGGNTAADTGQGQDQSLLREVFMYRGIDRDPFRSLALSGPELRPFLEDLRVTQIIYDARYPARSVAVLLDVDQQERYSVRVDDEFGRLRVFEIRAYTVVLTIEDFGVPRQVELSVRRRQKGSP